ncbi:hypothetical protein AB0K87_34790, partial [Streptomyces sp. NPDC053705]
MRSTENVRGEWDELGERDTRVIVPGPGTGDVPGPAGTEHGARLPEPGAEPDPLAESTAAVPDTMPVAGGPPAAEEEYIPADLGPALDAVAVVGLGMVYDASVSSSGSCSGLPCGLFLRRAARPAW